MLINAKSPELRTAMRAARSGYWGVAGLSLATGFFPIVVTLFVLLFFDVALPGHSGATVAGLLLVLFVVMGFWYALDLLRIRLVAQLGDVILAGMGNRIDATGGRLVRTMIDGQKGLEATRDLDAIRALFTHRHVLAWVDLAFVPLYVIVMIFFHAWLAVALMVATLVFGGLLLRALKKSRDELDSLATLTAGRELVAQAGRSNAPLLRALGMRDRASRSWILANLSLGRATRLLAEGLATLGLRMEILAVAVLLAIMGVGGWLAISDRASNGILVGSVLLSAFAIRPLLRALDSAAAYAAGKRGLERLDDRIRMLPEEPSVIELPQPKATLQCEGLALLPPGGGKPLVRNVSLELKSGDVMAVIGGAGAGKSALVRGLAGCWEPAAGTIRLDGGALDQWDSDDLARHIGYLPQEGGLISGSVAENIARFDSTAEAQSIVDAAQAAGAHNMILRLSEGYGTHVGPGGAHLSGSQARRIGLARALFGSPFLLVLDEPASHLDLEGEQALVRAVQQARERGAIVILCGTDRILVELASHVIVMRDGMKADFGLKDEVRARADEARKKRQAAQRLAGQSTAQGKVISDQDKAQA